MAYSYVTYTGDNIETDFVVPFSYIAESNVKVYLNDVLQTQVTHYDFLNASTIQFVTAPGAGVEVKIRRITEATNSLVTYVDGSVDNASTRNIAQNQVFYRTQEIDDNITLAGLGEFTDITLTTPTINYPIIQVKDSEFTIADNADGTKRLQFEVSGISAGATRTYTAPNASGTITLIGLAQTLTNKTLSTGTVIAADNTSTSTGAWAIAVGTTGERPGSPATGQIRFNSTIQSYEGYNGTAWSSIGGGAAGGGTDHVFYENDKNVTTNYTITTNKNAVSAGPITIDNGITVTVPSGSTWTVV